DRGLSVGPSDVFPVASRRDDLGHTMEGWKMLQGRAANPARADEAVASFELASALHLNPGSTIDFHFFTAKAFPGVAASLLSQFPERVAHGGGEFSFAKLADGPRVKVRIVGIEASPAEFPPRLLDISPILHLTPSFFAHYSNTVVGSPITYIRLKHH